MSKIKDYLIEKQGSVDESELRECTTCGRTLPPPVLEDRGGGNIELVTYCECGAKHIMTKIRCKKCKGTHILVTTGNDETYYYCTDCTNDEVEEVPNG